MTSGNETATAMKDEKTGSGKRDMLAETIMHTTLDLHDMAEKCSFIVRMVDCKIHRPQYKLLLADYHVVYSALEEETAKLENDPVFGAMYCPDELNRVEAIEKDLVFFYGEKWRKYVNPTKAALKYADYIHHIGKVQPSLILAHAFVRYLGDLSGGQILKFKMTKCMALPPGKGVSFYDFDKVKNAMRLNNYILGRINNLDLDSELYDQIVEEARVAFQLNINFFDELEPRAAQIERMLDPPKNVVLFEKIWQASTVVLSFAVMYNLSKALELSV